MAERVNGEMMVADLPSGATIIIAREGQPVPTDAKVLREQYGIRPDQIIPYSASRARPATKEEIAAGLAKARELAAAGA